MRIDYKFAQLFPENGIIEFGDSGVGGIAEVVGFDIL